MIFDNSGSVYVIDRVSKSYFKVGGKFSPENNDRSLSQNIELEIGSPDSNDVIKVSILKITRDFE